MKLGDKITLAHGGGGLASRELVEELIAPRFGKGPLEGFPDAARVDVGQTRLVFTTDSFVVSPRRFPGGDLGALAVYGTVNDIAVSGGKPLWLSLALILEEGFPTAELAALLDSVKLAADRSGVGIATGDTKVVSRGQCDGMFVNTAGLGIALEGFDLGPHRIREGDVVLVSGSLGEHGAAVMAARAGLFPEGGVRSDAGPVHELVATVRELACDVRCMRDPTRGGIAASLNELLGKRRDIGIRLFESELPFSPGARAVSELLGIDLLNAACEGRLVAICDPRSAPEIVRRFRALPEGSFARAIGVVTKERGRVVLETSMGGTRLVDVPHSELLPRIC